MSMTITCADSVANTTVTATLPDPVVAMLQWLSDNVMVPEPANPGQITKKYLYPANVIWRDAIDILLPIWQAQYAAGQVAALNNQIAQAQATIAGQVQQAVAAITVVGP